MAWLRVLDGVIGYGTGGTDLGAIPTTAVQRIEVLRDGAAAQYGSDAIAAVINLELRDRTDGGELTVHGGTGDGNGSRRGVAFNGGVPLGAGGFLNVTGEWYKEDPLNRNGGNGGLDPDFQDELIAHSSPLNDSAFLFLNAGLPIGDAGELYAFGGLSRREGRASGAHHLDRNPNATVAGIIANAGPLAGNSGGIEFDQLTLNFDVRRTFDGGPLSALAAGVEHRMENYRQIAGDEASWSCGLPHAEDYGAFAVGPDGAPLMGTVAACGFQGYPGYSPRNAELSDDGRDNQGAYVEVELQPSNTLSIGAALRAENYSDAGSQTTGKLAARFDLGGGFALRGALSTGFRAPSLSQRRFNSILFVGSETGLTTVFAANEGHAVARAFGVGSLNHETSKNLSAGLVLSLDNFELSFDAYRTDIEDRVVRSRGLDCAGIAACDAARVATAAFFFNGVNTETQGADLSMRWGTPLAGGHLLLSANANVNKTEIVAGKVPAGAPTNLTFSDYFGGWTAEIFEHGQPRRQANVTADWEHARYGGLLRLNHFGATTQHPLDTGMIRIDAATTVDVEARFRAGIVRGALGINNVADELPTELPKTHLANILWGIRYPTETPFGLFGRFAYLRLSVEFAR